MFIWVCLTILCLFSLYLLMKPLCIIIKTLRKPEKEFDFDPVQLCLESQEVNRTIKDACKLLKCREDQLVFKCEQLNETITKREQEIIDLKERLKES